MKTLGLNNGFSLIEVNMAVFVMAVGVLSMAVLYPLGLRESTQGQADLKQSMFADCVLNQVVALASQTNVTWNSWKNIPKANNFTKGGWQDVKDLPALKTDTGEAVFSKVKIPSEMAGRYRVGACLVPGASDKIMGVMVQSSELETVSSYSQFSNNPVYYAEVLFQGNPI